MQFYDALQMDAAVLKRKARAAATPQESRWYWKALLTRDVLMVAFAIVFISALSALFGKENSGMAVVLFCILQSVRFVDFDYAIGDSLRSLAAVFLLLFLCPLLTQETGRWLGFFIHMASLLAILVMTCEKPELGNGGLYMFSYIFLTGNAVRGALVWQRLGMTALGYLLCAAVLYRNHRHKGGGRTFSHVLRRFSLRDPKCQWQLQVALGVSLLFLLGSFLPLGRFMWCGFACSSLLSSYTDPLAAPGPSAAAGQISERMRDRAAGVVLGSLLFGLVYHITPPALTGLFGPAAGLCLGLCGHYRYKTIFNCFGALLLASDIYGMAGAISLRILDNFVGLAFGFVFFHAYQRLFVHGLLKRF